MLRCPTCGGEYTFFSSSETERLIRAAAGLMALGARVRHIRGGWTATVIERPSDADERVAPDAVWLLPDKGGLLPHMPASRSPECFAREFRAEAE